MPGRDSGAFTIDRTLHIFGTGNSLITSGGAASTSPLPVWRLPDGLAGALIDGNFATGTGSAITVTLANGDVDLAPGSIIRSNGKSGGAIKITTTATHTIDIDGLSSPWVRSPGLERTSPLAAGRSRSSPAARSR